MEEGKFIELAKKAKYASKKIATLPVGLKNTALLNIAKNLKENQEKIFEANKRDLEEALPLVESGELKQSVFNRLKLDENKMRDMIQGIIDISNLEDPIGKTLLKRQLDDGLILTKISCPIGVLGIIFEARPDVISQISALAIKSSNAVILKGGKESINTNKEIMVTSTSCNIVDFDTFKEEIIRNNFKIIKCYISSDIPNFDKCICAIISK